MQQVTERGQAAVYLVQCVVTGALALALRDQQAHFVNYMVPSAGYRGVMPAARFASE